MRGAVIVRYPRTGGSVVLVALDLERGARLGRLPLAEPGERGHEQRRLRSEPGGISAAHPSRKCPATMATRLPSGGFTLSTLHGSFP